MSVNIDHWELGKRKILKNPKKIFVDSLGYSSDENIVLGSLDKYFDAMANVKFGWLTASARPLFRAPRPGCEKTTISIEIKYHSTQKASYRIKRGLIHKLSGHVLQLIANGICYGFLNIYNILRLSLISKILSDFKGLKSHPIHDV